MIDALDWYNSVLYNGQILFLYYLGERIVVLYL